MSDYSKILDLVEDEKVKFSVDLPKDLHTKLVLGQTRYVCRYGTLSDGHEKLTSAQRYYQAIKEMYSLGQNIQLQKANSMEQQANLLEAEYALQGAPENSPRELRAKAAFLRAKTALTNCLVTIEDQMRMLDEYNRIRQELQEEVETKYPLGIEQAEEDNWRAVFEYRMLKTQAGSPELVSNIPLDPVEKAKLGVKYQRIDAIAPLIIAKQESFEKFPNEDPEKLNKFIEFNDIKSEVI